MRGPSSSGSRRSSSGQAVQLLDFSQHPQHAPTPPPACLRRSAPHRGQQRRTPRGDPGRCHLNLLLQMWKQSQKRQQERINLQTEKCKQNGKGEQRENRQKWLNLWFTRIKWRSWTRGEPRLWGSRKGRSYVWLISHTGSYRWSLPTFSFNPDEDFY